MPSPFPANVIRRLNAIKGPPASILWALLFANQPVGRDDLIIATGYGKDSVTSGLRKLEAQGIVFRTSRYHGWEITTHMRQLLMPLILDEGRANKSPSLPDSTTTNESSFNNTDLIVISGKAKKSPSTPNPVDNSVDNSKLSTALLNANIQRNVRTEPLFNSNHITPDHVIRWASELKSKYHDKYRTGLLIYTLENITPGEPLPLMRETYTYCPICFNYNCDNDHDKE